MSLYDPTVPCNENIEVNIQEPVTIWGNILGSLKDQTDLWAQLSGFDESLFAKYLSSEHIILSSTNVRGDLQVDGTIYTQTTAIVLGTYNSIIGDGAANVFDIEHNLGTKNTSVVVREIGTDLFSYPSIEAINDNTTRLSFSFVLPSSAYEVSVFAGVPSTRVAAYTPDIFQKLRANTLYVSMSGKDTNTGRDPNYPLRTIRKACQIAHNDRVVSQNDPNVKYTVQVFTGDYVEENPIYVPPTVSIIGDNLRRCTIRPKNKQYDIFWVDNSSYIWGFTFRDHLHPAAAVAFPNFSVPSLTSIALNDLMVPFVRKSLDYNKDKCKRDLGYILEGIQEDIQSGDNAQSLFNGSSYYVGMNLVFPESQILPTVQAIQYAQTLVKDELILDPLTNTQAMLTSVDLLFDTVVETISSGPGSAVTQNFEIPENTAAAISIIENNKEQIKTGVIAYIDALYPDIYKWRKPYITTSPYIQGSSSITTGTNGISAGCGMRVDGALAEGFLRSMVLDSYTQFNQGGQGIHILNNGYAQLVSIFTICCTEGIKCETGGTCSISNSNCSFGLSGIVAVGKSPVPILTGTLVEDPFGGNTFLVTNVEGTIINPNSDYYSPAAPIDTRRIAYTPYNGLIFTVGDSDPELFITEKNPPPFLSAGEDNIFVVSVVQNTFKHFTPGDAVKFYLRSIASASSHTFEYVGTGIYLSESVPALGGITKKESEVCFDNEGVVYFTSTNEGGDFNVGEEFIIVQETGTIEGDTFKRSILTLVTPLNLALE